MYDGHCLFFSFLVFLAVVTLVICCAVDNDEIKFYILSYTTFARVESAFHFISSHVNSQNHEQIIHKKMMSIK